MDPIVEVLVGLTALENDALVRDGINTQDELSYLNYADIEEVLPNSTIVKRRKLEQVAKWIADGNQVFATTTMQEIKTANRTTSLPPRPPDINKGALKIGVDSLKKFSGDPIDFEDYEIGTKATLGQTQYAHFLDNAPTPGNIIEVARDKELYNLFVTSFKDGSGMHILQGIATESGHSAWNAIQTWYGTNATSQTIITHYRTRLDLLFLDENFTASDYVNEFIICSKKLEDKHEGMTPVTKMEKFLEHITSEEYDVTVQNLQMDGTKTFESCCTAIRLREQKILKMDKSTAKARRTRNDTSEDKDRNKDRTPTQDGNIPSIPGFILHKIKDKNVKTSLIKWRGIYNSERRTIQPDECGFKSKSSDPEDASNSGKPHSTVKNGKRKVRRTTTSTTGVKESSLRVRFKEDDEEDEESATDDDDDDDARSDPKAKNKKRKRKKKGNKRTQMRRVIRALKRTSDPARAIMDPGTEHDIIGGEGWKILSKESTEEATLGGALNGMGSRNLPVVMAITAVDTIDGTFIMGAGRAGWDNRPSQTESLFNTHDLRAHGVVVNDVTKRDGGEQNLIVDGIKIPLNFVDNKTL